MYVFQGDILQIFFFVLTEISCGHTTNVEKTGAVMVEWEIVIRSLLDVPSTHILWGKTEGLQVSKEHSEKPVDQEFLEFLGGK